MKKQDRILLVLGIVAGLIIASVIIIYADIQKSTLKSHGVVCIKQDGFVLVLIPEKGIEECEFLKK